ncbi:MAG TPA: helix-turn-helix transcriptional regulator, partial [Acidimicrobiales bacterium]|nr:helix-turn-helix transcriptional regulator [Acidimicrobiales bacterium]
MREGELGQFLRSRREATSPASVGLPVGPRRRTPGLRRAELATLAGISVDYLVRLEQGRDRRPSAQVLMALADALRLGRDDRDHLRLLGTISLGPELCPALSATARSVRPTVQTMLDMLEPAPAFVLNRLSDLLAWTGGYERLAGPIGILDGDRPNLVRFTFADRRARVAYPDWDAVADEQVANVQHAYRPSDDEWAALLADLEGGSGPAFTDRWDARLVARKRTGVKRIVHPEVGEVRVAFETLQLPDPDDQRLVVYLPGDIESARALDALAGRHPGNL